MARIKARAAVRDQDPIFRVVWLALMYPNPPPDLTQALATLLKPKRVRQLLGPWYDARLGVAVFVATNALGPKPRRDVSRVLAAALGVPFERADELIASHRAEKYRDGVRSAAMDLVAEIEQLSSRTVRKRVKSASKDLDGLGYDVVRATLGLPLK